MKIVCDIFIGVNCLRIGNNTFDCQRLNCIDIFNISDEILIAYFLRICASAVFSTQKVSKFFIFDQI